MPPLSLAALRFGITKRSKEKVLGCENSKILVHFNLSFKRITYCHRPIIVIIVIIFPQPNPYNKNEKPSEVGFF